MFRMLCIKIMSNCEDDQSLSLMPLHGISGYMDFAKWTIILATREEDEIKPAKITEVKII